LETIDRRRPELLNVNRIIQVSTVHRAQISARQWKDELYWKRIIPRNSTQFSRTMMRTIIKSAFGYVDPFCRSRIVVNTTAVKLKEIGNCHSKLRINVYPTVSIRSKLQRNKKTEKAMRDV